MKKVYVNEQWCLGCRLCEVHCTFSQTGESDMARALKDKELTSNIKVQTDNTHSFAVSCRHCDQPLCQKSCITGALSKDCGVVTVDTHRCIKCYTCILVCPVGGIAVGESGVAQKCGLCLQTTDKTPSCVKGCPNAAIVYEERG
ncbi:MAG: 4Fe-4S binding protein [Oscillospiraceae bacterium]|nr:4Fe-4S binding protein [Oscillospiraceae bacterium]